MSGKNYIYRIINKFISLYKHKAEVLGKDALGHCGDNVILSYPFILGEPEAISIGEDTTILAESRLQVYNYLSDKNASIKIGKHCYITHRFCVLAGADITIGDDVLIASDVTIVSENHSFNPEDKISYMDQKLKSAPVAVGGGYLDWTGSYYPAWGNYW